MRRTGWLLVFVVGLLWLVEELPPSLDSAQPGCDTDWRRTSDGWERLDPIASPADTSCSPALHPVLLAVAQVLLSLFALVAWGTAASQENPPRHARNSRPPGH